MSPAERIKQVTETTRVSLPVVALVGLLTTAGGAVGAGYTAREQILSRVDMMMERRVLAERATSDLKYLTREEFAREVRVPLVELRTEVRELSRRLESRR